MSKQYSISWLGFLTRVLFIPILFTLTILDKYDQGSD